MPTENLDAMVATLKKATAALRDAGVPFMLGGGLAAWARGGPESDHDLDLMVKPEDADEALEVLAAAGFPTERPPEGWLYKAWDDNDVMVDVIFEPTGVVMVLEDVFVTKLLALDEQTLDYKPLLQIARSLRERADWDEVRERTKDSPYAAAFFTLVEELGVVEKAAKGA